jgi:choline dehydrogenase-like flavoprotein
MRSGCTMCSGSACATSCCFWLNGVWLAPTRPFCGANYLASPQDLKDLAAGIVMARNRQLSGPATVYRPRGRRRRSRRRRAGRLLPQRARHPLAPVGHGEDGPRCHVVVDGRLRVYGVDGLGIADASLMPRVTTGNTMTPCVVIGERASGFLKPRSGRAASFSCLCRLLTLRHN